MVYNCQHLQHGLGLLKIYNFQIFELLKLALSILPRADHWHSTFTFQIFGYMHANSVLRGFARGHLNCVCMT